MVVPSTVAPVAPLGSEARQEPPKGVPPPNPLAALVPPSFSLPPPFGLPPPPFGMPPGEHACPLWSVPRLRYVHTHQLGRLWCGLALLGSFTSPSCPSPHPVRERRVHCILFRAHLPAGFVNSDVFFKGAIGCCHETRPFRGVEELFLGDR